MCEYNQVKRSNPPADLLCLEILFANILAAGRADSSAKIFARTKEI